MKMSNSLISIVISCYEDEQNILLTIEEIISSLEKLNNFEYELIVVDDCSNDNSVERVKSLKNHKIKCIENSLNYGQHKAILIGLSQAKGDCVVFLAADGQNNPNVIPDLVEKWTLGSKIVWALRKDRDEKGIKKIPISIFYFFIKYFTRKLNIDFNVSRADFALLDKDVINSFNLDSGINNITVHELIFTSKYQQDYIEYIRRLRHTGKSTWTLAKKINLAISVLFGLLKRHSLSILLGFLRSYSLIKK
jgi:polyisoprenyl-phosphate glycosyltransferase